MKAAVVESFPNPPKFQDFAEPEAGNGEIILSVRAAALSQLVRMQASGKHYSSGKPPFVPGADGVGVTEEGKRAYFAFPRSPIGSMAERVAVRRDYTVSIPDTIDDIMAAAIANPGMSSWAALTERAKIKKGETVLINGATGSSGQLAIQIAKHLGAGRILATGRNPEYKDKILSLGATEFIELGDFGKELEERFRSEIHSGLNIVLDYLWGAPAEAFFSAAVGHDPSGKAAPRIRFINIGSLAGPNISLNAASIRSSGVEILGSGLGSVSNETLVRCIGTMLSVVKSEGLFIETESFPLSDVESVWKKESSKRVVFTVSH